MKTKNKKKMRGYREFLYVLPFVILVLIFCYYPLYGWRYAFYDYQPPYPAVKNQFPRPMSAAIS